MEYWKCSNCKRIFNHEDDACPECGGTDIEGEVNMADEYEELRKENEQLELKTIAYSEIIKHLKSKTIEKLLNMLKNQGGCVVSTRSLSADSINIAREEGRMWVNKYGYGYVWLKDTKSIERSNE